MNRIMILGDSNIYRNVTADGFSTRISTPTTILNTARLATLETRLKELSEDDHSIVVISSLDNILSDYGRGIETDDLEDVIGKAVNDYVDLVSKSTELKERVLLCPPLYRSDPVWFADLLLYAKERLSLCCTFIPNRTVIPEFRVSGIDLEKDGVHLIPEVGLKYIEHLASCLKDILCVSQSSKMAHGSTSHPIFSTGSEPTNADIMSCLQNVVMPRLNELAGIKSHVEQLERKFLTRVASDDVECARDREELDNLKNDKWQDRVIVSGLEGEDYPNTPSDQKSYLAGRLRKLTKHIVGKLVFDVYPCREGKMSNVKIPAFEVRFPTVQYCDKFKSQAYKVVKEEEFKDLSTCIFSHKLTLATRVRTEILRAIARKLNIPEESGYCPIHNPRPILQVGRLQDGKVVPMRTMTFVDQ